MTDAYRRFGARPCACPECRDAGNYLRDLGWLTGKISAVFIGAVAGIYIVAVSVGLI